MHKSVGRPGILLEGARSERIDCTESAHLRHTSAIRPKDVQQAVVLCRAGQCKSQCLTQRQSSQDVNETD